MIDLNENKTKIIIVVRNDDDKIIYTLLTFHLYYRYDQWMYNLHIVIAPIYTLILRGTLTAAVHK